MSRSTPQILKECHRLRRHLRELQSEIDLGPRVQKIQQATLAAAEAAHKAAHESVKRLKLKQKDDEVSLKQTETQLAKFQADVNTAGSKKEYDLKNTEIATATAKKGDLEDAILGGMAGIEDESAALPAADAAWTAARAEYATQQADAAGRMVRLKAEVVDATAKLAAAEAELPDDVKPLIARLVRQYGADAMAGVQGRACQQCRTTITEQWRTSLISGQFLCCTQCGRALYLADG